jgi:hypothetical protein
LKWIISVKLPNGDDRTYTTTNFKERDNRILFLDKFGQPKNFPKDACFIEGVDQ